MLIEIEQKNKKKKKHTIKKDKFSVICNCFLNPRFGSKDRRVETGVSFPGASGSSRNDAAKSGTTVDWADEGSARVTLAGIFAAVDKVVFVEIVDSSAYVT